jgi:hypothetical protein
LELIILRPLFIFFYALIGAAGAGELIPEYDYADDFTAEDYPTLGLALLILKYLLGIAI